MSKLKNSFGGRGTADENLDNAHGITVDTRTGTTTLIVTDRNKNCFKRFSLEGKLMEIIQLPGAGVCRPVIKGDYLYAAVLRSPMSVEKSGFVTILNKDNKFFISELINKKVLLKISQPLQFNKQMKKIKLIKGNLRISLTKAKKKWDG